MLRVARCASPVSLCQVSDLLGRWAAVRFHAYLRWQLVYTLTDYLGGDLFLLGMSLKTTM
jgi:hypothetical protein